MSKISSSKLRKDVFNQVDQNQNKKIDKEELKEGQIFGLKEGDKRIKRRGFDKNLAIDFMRAKTNKKDIAYKEVIKGDAYIEECYKCLVREKDIGVDIDGLDNTAIVQHDNGHKAAITKEGIQASVPENEQEEAKEIGLCVECEVNIVDDTIEVDGKDNTLVYQNENKTVVIDKNQEPVRTGGQNEVSIDECVDCSREIINSHTSIDGKANKVITQFGDKNKANIEK